MLTLQNHNPLGTRCLLRSTDGWVVTGKGKATAGTTRKTSSNVTIRQRAHPLWYFANPEFNWIGKLYLWQALSLTRVACPLSCEGENVSHHCQRCILGELCLYGETSPCWIILAFINFQNRVLVIHLRWKLSCYNYFCICLNKTCCNNNFVHNNFTFFWNFLIYLDTVPRVVSKFLSN